MPFLLVLPEQHRHKDLDKGYVDVESLQIIQSSW